MIKNTMQINLSAIELAALFKEFLKQDEKISLYYNYESNNNLGVSYSIEVENIHYNKDTIDFIFNNNTDSFSILVPKEMNDKIECSIVHNQIVEIDYDNLSDSDTELFLYGRLDESNIKYKKKTRNVFKISFDNFDTQVTMDYNKFYQIIGNLAKSTSDYIAYLNELKAYDNQVDIDGFWESIDNMLEK